jgi:ribosomal protein L11 methyltransferase
MLSPDSKLYVYEVEGDAGDCLSMPPDCYLGLWNEDNLSYLFFTERQDEYVSDCLSKSSCSLKRRHDTIYSEWQDGMPADGLTTDELFFVPDDYPAPPPGALLLDPSVVFGDGTHPTTLACLKFMRGCIVKGGVKTMLDLGTGTGILSIGAAALGVSRVTAVDLNVLAVQTARKNVDLNRLGSKIMVEEGDATEFLNEDYDLAVANLPLEVLEKISDLEGITRVQNWVISGISEAQGRVIERHFVAKGFQRNGFQNIHPWVTFGMIRNPRSQLLGDAIISRTTE